MRIVMLSKPLSLILFVLLLGGCATQEKPEADREYSKSFRVPYESIWRATQQALLNYPMNINNMDTGQLQTLYITGKHRYRAPHSDKNPLPSGYQYRLNVNIIRGEEISRVVINKEVRLQKDFFSDPKELATDGYEEKMLLYRIKRELLIEKLLKRRMEEKQEG
jgi:outer membrane lipopolysaccharide assembly protein LptE/RlpB